VLIRVIRGEKTIYQRVIEKFRVLLQKNKIMDYTIRIKKDNKSGWLTGQCEQLPEAITQTIRNSKT